MQDGDAVYPRLDTPGVDGPADWPTLLCVNFPLFLSTNLLSSSTVLDRGSSGKRFKKADQLSLCIPGGFIGIVSAFFAASILSLCGYG